MSRLPHTSSYYAVTANPAPDRPALQGTVECDVCVIGGGIAGCSTALHLAERGYRVVLLEEQRIGWGASGRSGAQAIFGVACGHSKLERLIGREPARAVWDVSIEGLSLMRHLIDHYSIACDWVDGQMLTAIKPRQDSELRVELRELQNKLAYNSIRYMSTDETQSVLATRRYISALYDSNGGHLHPLNYTLGLAAAAETLGARIFEGTRALSYVEGDIVSVKTPDGEVRCRHLALCGNAYLNGTAPELAAKIMAVGTYIVATAPLSQERARALIANNACVSDTNWILDYFRLTADQRLLFGGRVSYSGLDPFQTAESTRVRMLQVFPQLAGVNLDYSWGGYVDITRNRAPHFGRLAGNVYFLQGFSGHGISLTGIAGKLLADAIDGSAARFDVFAKIPHHGFPGGAAFRRPALVAAMMYFRLKDLL